MEVSLSGGDGGNRSEEIRGGWARGEDAANVIVGKESLGKEEVKT